MRDWKDGRMEQIAGYLPLTTFSSSIRNRAALGQLKVVFLSRRSCKRPSKDFLFKTLSN